MDNLLNNGTEDSVLNDYKVAVNEKNANNFAGENQDWMSGAFGPTQTSPTAEQPLTLTQEVSQPSPKTTGNDFVYGKEIPGKGSIGIKIPSPEERKLPARYYVDNFVPDANAPKYVQDMSLIERIGRDVAKGSTQVPRSAYRGFINFADGFLNTVEPFGIMQRGGTQEAFKELGLLPEEADTNTGKMAEDVFQFLYGTAMAGKAFEAAGAGLKAAGLVAKEAKLGKTAAVAVKGVLQPAVGEAIAFDPQEERLSNIVYNLSGGDEALMGKVASYLKADKDDPILEARIKQLAEGALTNVAGEALIRGVRGLRAMKKASTDPKLKEQLLKESLAQKQAVNEGIKARMSVMGDPNAKEYFTTKPSPKETRIKESAKDIEQAISGNTLPSNEPEVYINYNKINTSDDIKNVIRQFAGIEKPSIKAETRGVRSNKATIEAAKAIKAEEKLLGREVGQALNAEEITAGRQLLVNSAKQLQELANAVNINPDDVVAKANLVKAMTTHNAIQKSLKGATTEAGRALQAYNIAISESDDMAKAMAQIIDQSGGTSTIDKMAEKLSRIPQGREDMVDDIIQAGLGKRSLDAIEEAWKLGLLSGPKTHARNIASNTIASLNTVLERTFTAFTSDDVSKREALVYAKELFKSMREGFTASKDAWKSFNTLDAAKTAVKTESKITSALAKETLDPNGKMGWLSDGLQAYGSMLRNLSIRPLSSADAFFKTILFKAEKGALLTRRGISMGLKGQELDNYIAEGMTVADDLIDEQAKKYALVNTFNNDPEGFGAIFSKMMQKHRFTRVLMPFARTPVNVFEYGFERTPLAPAFKSWRDRVAMGGAEASLAKGQMYLGTMQMMTLIDMANSGYITGSGPSDRSQRQALLNKGWRPYSVKLGDKYISYNGLEPLSSLLGISADLAEVQQSYSQYGDKDAEEINDIINGSVIAFLNQLTNKGYLQNISQFSDAVSDPTRYAESWLKGMAGSIVPSFVRAGTQAITNEQKYVRTMTDAVRARVWGLEKGLETKTNLWGEPLRYRPQATTKAGKVVSGAVSVFNPFQVSLEENSPIDQEILNVDANVSMPNWKQTFNGGAVDLKEYPTAYWEFVRLAGNDMKPDAFRNMGCKDYLNYLITTPMYFNAPLEAKQKMIENTIENYRTLAKQEILKRYPDVKAEANLSRETVLQLKMQK